MAKKRDEAVGDVLGMRMRCLEGVGGKGRLWRPTCAHASQVFWEQLQARFQRRQGWFHLPSLLFARMRREEQVLERVREPLRWLEREKVRERLHTQELKLREWRRYLERQEQQRREGAAPVQPLATHEATRLLWLWKQGVDLRNAKIPGAELGRQAGASGSETPSARALASTALGAWKGKRGGSGMRGRAGEAGAAGARGGEGRPGSVGVLLKALAAMPRAMGAAGFQPWLGSQSPTVARAALAVTQQLWKSWETSFEQRGMLGFSAQPGAAVVPLRAVLPGRAGLSGTIGANGWSGLEAVSGSRFFSGGGGNLLRKDAGVLAGAGLLMLLPALTNAAFGLGQLAGAGSASMLERMGLPLPGAKSLQQQHLANKWRALLPNLAVARRPGLPEQGARAPELSQALLRLLERGLFAHERLALEVRRLEQRVEPFRRGLESGHADPSLSRWTHSLNTFIYGLPKVVQQLERRLWSQGQEPGGAPPGAWAHARVQWGLLSRRSDARDARAALQTGGKLHSGIATNAGPSERRASIVSWSKRSISASERRTESRARSALRDSGATRALEQSLGALARRVLRREQPLWRQPLGPAIFEPHPGQGRLFWRGDSLTWRRLPASPKRDPLAVKLDGRWRKGPDGELAGRLARPKSRKAMGMEREDEGDRRSYALKNAVRRLERLFMMRALLLPLWAKLVAEREPPAQGRREDFSALTRTEALVRGRKGLERFAWHGERDALRLVAGSKPREALVRNPSAFALKQAPRAGTVERWLESPSSPSDRKREPRQRRQHSDGQWSATLRYGLERLAQGLERGRGRRLGQMAGVFREDALRSGLGEWPPLRRLLVKQNLVFAGHRFEPQRDETGSLKGLEPPQNEGRSLLANDAQRLILSRANHALSRWLLLLKGEQRVPLKQGFASSEGKAGLAFVNAAGIFPPSWRQRTPAFSAIQQRKASQGPPSGSFLGPWQAQLSGALAGKHGFGSGFKSAASFSRAGGERSWIFAKTPAGTTVARTLRTQIEPERAGAKAVTAAGSHSRQSQPFQTLRELRRLSLRAVEQRASFSRERLQPLLLRVLLGTNFAGDSRAPSSLLLGPGLKALAATTSDQAAKFGLRTGANASLTPPILAHRKASPAQTPTSQAQALGVRRAAPLQRAMASDDLATRLTLVARTRYSTTSPSGKSKGAGSLSSELNKHRGGQAQAAGVGASGRDEGSPSALSRRELFSPRIIDQLARKIAQILGSNARVERDKRGL